MPAAAIAGGGPENVLLVVNELDDDSKTIANHYAQWRNIPASNILYVEFGGSLQDCSAEKFRTRVLRPIVKAIEQRRLGAQIDYVVYSAGFPWRISLQTDYPKQKFGPGLRPVASLTGATYLWQYVLKKNPAIVTPGVNYYVPKAPTDNLIKCRNLAGVPSRAFRLRYSWKSDGTKTADAKSGQRYLLSTMLGVTTGRGNTAAEVLAYLRRAVQADHTQPTGTFYFARNTNPRSETRHDCFEGVAAALQVEGAQARIVSGTAPRGAADIIGLTTGAEECNLAAHGSRIRPGAICEHLTSFGGDLASNRFQMPLTEFLRQGAAGACGTVVEPRAIQTKFPLPSLHLHYRRGCSLAEAFYQSVSGPYQLLIVGDPLCQPWAKPPQIEVEGAVANQSVSGTIEITPRVSGPSSGARLCELFVNGRLRARSPPGKPIKLDTTKFAEGNHELRLVACSADAIESQSRVILPITVDNDPAATLEFSTSPSEAASAQDWIELIATTPGGEGTVSFLQGERRLGTVKLKPAGKAADGATKHTAKLRVAAEKLGRGPVELRAMVVGHGPRAAPITLTIR